MLVGAAYCGALFFFLEEILLKRMASLNHEITKVTVSGDLSLRSSASGQDELGALAKAVNAMLTAIQKTKSDLLQAQESLRFHAEHDALTGVLNRRAIRDLLRKELARCRRERSTLGVILADVDHFKKINDRYGHGAGDAVLVTAMQRISSCLRSYDVVGRYGGEEFLIIAPGCDLELAQKLAERIRTAVSEQPVDLGDASHRHYSKPRRDPRHRRKRPRIPGHPRRQRHVSSQAQRPQPGRSQPGVARDRRIGSLQLGAAPDP